MQAGQDPYGSLIAGVPVSVYVHVKMGLMPAQVHSGEQSESMPSASAGREASVLELADLDREVTSSLLTPSKPALTFCHLWSVYESLAEQP